RRTILKQTPVPWPVFGEERVTELLVKVFREQAPGAKMKQQLYEYATCHDEPQLAEWLASEARFEQAANFAQQRATFGRKTYVPYFANHFKDILKQCEQYGVEHRLPMNQTPLMAAAAAGNLPLVEALLDRGADRDAVDQYGYNALHWALREGFREAKFARGPLAALYERLAPASIDISTGERLVRLDRHLSEYFLFQTLWVLFKSRFTHRQRRTNGAFEAQAILDAWQFLPANIVRPERNKRQHLSSVLARNEIDRDYAYNRALFKRVSQGWYQFNPKLAVRRRQGDEETWAPVFAALNLPLINEFSRLNDWGWPEPIPKVIDRFLLLTGLPGWRVPIAAERSVARARALEEERLVEARALQAQREAEQAAAAQRPVRWDGPQAKRLEIERIRREIEARKKR
ncbi:MAG: ankyrin repeat domain-containing protein, partial [Candidatus Accumulibacter phosphatis]|uniref:ankyrin repeat domain-containing protein n=1 Tax=Candidatus Accumulibacter phosphatis TaxID=327160 RepID=UPI001A5D8D39|nr:ankyrin repeat domain-containing protein [Candidatus Accumulibacter phosphatis]